MRLDEPVELLRELEETLAARVQIRRTADDNLILDVDDDQAPSSAPPDGTAPLPFIPPAPWRSGYAAACKAVYTGSIPVGASRLVGDSSV